VGLRRAVGVALRLLGLVVAGGVTFLLWFAYAMVAVEGHDSRPILELGWWLGLAGSCVTLLMLVRSPATTWRAGAAYSLVTATLLAAWVMQQSGGLRWGRIEVTMAAVAIAALASSVLVVVPPLVHEWQERGPYVERPRD